jgi:8-oxo-dGTP pyrophosphatase MutT (NUDIX family)
MPSEVFESIVEGLGKDEPGTGGLRLAAVSVILDGSDSLNVLLIKRAERPGDPWSGQVAFPGGKTQPGDGTARGTAARETLEEVGIELDKTAEFLGYGNSTRTHTGTMEVVPSVYLLKKETKIRPNEEVASYRWVSLKRLLSPSVESTYELRYEGQTVQMPAFAVDDYVVWGLTHRIIVALVQKSKDGLRRG